MNVTTQITENFDNAAQTIVDTNDRVLDTVVSVNRRIVDTVVTMNERVADRAPRFEMPFSGQFPTPAEAGKQYLGFVQRAASMNREVTARVVGQLPAGVATTTKANATKAAKPAAQKVRSRT